MANALAIRITADDQATKVLNDLNKRVSQMTRPFQNMQRSLRNFGKAAGLGKLKDGLEGMTRTAQRTAAAFGKIGAPLTALVGGGTIAGLFALTEGWAKFGLQLQQTATMFGVDTQALYDFQNAARLVGISGQAATQTFESFADTLQDARWGRNQPAMGLLLGLGIQLKTTKAGAIDSMDALGQVADKVQAFQKAGKTGAARTIVRQLGLTSLMPFLMLGKKGIEEYEAQSRKLAGSFDWKLAREAGLQWNALTVAMEGTKNAIAASLLPVITPLIQQFGSWIQANRQLIATDIGDFIKGLGNAFKGLSLKTVLDDVLAIVKGFGGLSDKVANLIGDVGGLKRVLEGLGIAWAAPKALKIAKTSAKVATVGSVLGGKAGSAIGKAVAGDTGAAALGFLGSLAAPVGIGLAVNSMWNGKIGKYDFNSWGALFNSFKAPGAASAPGPSADGGATAQASGIAANIQARSGNDSSATGDNGQSVSLYGAPPAGGATTAAARGALATQIAAPVPPINLSVQITVQKDGSATTKMQTPSGVKIVHTSPTASIS